jgi:hypothetical protein
MMTEESHKDNSAFDPILERVRELNREGFDWGQAWGKAWLEQRILEWPSAWGDDLQVLIYGDFEPPKEDLHIPALRITVHPGKLENTVIRSAMCVLKATVAIDEKSVPALVDAGRRINNLLGAYTLVNWGNGASGWWSYVTHGSGGAAGTVLAHEDLDRALTGITRLPTEVRKKVDAALYWVREPRNLLMEFHRNDLLRIYSAYWNAFECLVEAVNILRPRQKLSRTEKQARIDAFVQEHGGSFTSSDIQECYQNIVNPGFVAKASHALTVCLGDEAAMYIDECFGLPDRHNRLYDIRNSINHGDVDAEHPEELLRIESRLHRLWMIVWRIFGRLVPFPAPKESSSTNASKDIR